MGIFTSSSTFVSSNLSLGLGVVFLLGSGSVAQAAGQANEAKMPDFTLGDAIPPKAKHDWNLGATGARGWMHTEDFTTRKARQIKVTQVAAGSPADTYLEVGDVLLGVGGKAFSQDPRTELGQALTLAESRAGEGKLRLTRWRAGKTEQVELQLPVLGEYGATAPYGCPKSQKVLALGCAALAKRMSEPKYKPDSIVRCLNALALLASGDARYLPLVKREAEWAAAYKSEGFRTWYYGYVMLLVAEYKLATGDASVLAGLRRLAVETAEGQSAVGSWGHDFARPDGRLKGYGMMNAPGLPLTIALVMAQQAGVTDAVVAQAIQRSAQLLRFYQGKGSIPYGDHSPWMDGHEDNGKCGMAAVLFHLLGEKEPSEFFAGMSLAAHGAERDCGHTGNFFNMLWALPSVRLCGPQATGGWMREFGAWYFDLARQWDGSFAHLGPPEPENDSYHRWDATGAYLLALALPKQALHITGKIPSEFSPLTATETEQHLALGRGWCQTDKLSPYEKLSDEAILGLLSSWSPIMRGRAAAIIGKRKGFPLQSILNLLKEGSRDAQLGACMAIENLRGRGAAAVPVLREKLKSPDLWLCIKAAYALAAIGKEAAPAIPDLLELLAAPPAADDPREMKQRFLTFAIFDSRGGLLARSLDGVDRAQLARAIRAGLKNQDGRARSDFSSVLSRLTLEEVQPLLPAILEAVQQPAPSGEMFADGIRVAGLRILATHHISEGIMATVEYLRRQNPWASEKRTPEILEALLLYGAQAQGVLAELEKVAADFADGEPDFPAQHSQRKATAVRDTMEKIKASTHRPQLRSLASQP